MSAPAQTNADAPVILDSAGSKIDKNFYIKKVRYVGSTAVGNQCTLHNYASTLELWTAYAAGSFADIETDFTGLMGGCLKAAGVKLTTLGAGKLYIYQ